MQKKNEDDEWNTAEEECRRRVEQIQERNRTNIKEECRRVEQCRRTQKDNGRNAEEEWN